MKKIYLSILGALLFASTAFAQPSNAPTTPIARNSGDVISIFSDAYTSSTPNLLINPNWEQPGAATVETIAGNEVVAVTNLTYQGLQFGPNPAEGETPFSLNASSMEFVHIDVWSETATRVNLSLISVGPLEKPYQITINPGWNSIDIPLSFYSPPVQLDKVFQFKFDGPLPGNGVTIYYDNIYFYKSSSTPTITGFSIPEKLTTDAAFTITAPTSNSAGAFTYTSSNAAVATVSGSTITIVGAGSTTITANQAANGGFNSGMATATLVVNYPPPTTAPATPPARNSADVISIYSEAYTNLPGVSYDTPWQQATQRTEQTFAGNKVQRLLNFNYQGIDLGGAKDVSAMDMLHIDIWTPDCSAFNLFLINAGKPEMFKALTPTLGAWKSFDIPLSDFTSQNVTLNDIVYFKLEAADFAITGNKTVYYDNVYFYKSGTLPVTLSSFDAKVKDNGVTLTWQTLSESNNKGFVIERSPNGKDWTNIGFEAGKGNSNSLSSYSFEDKTPSLGANYYRLVQQDNNNKETLSEIKTVNFSISVTQKINVYPNPATENLFIQLGEIKNDNSSLSLVDLKGSVIKSVNISKLSSSNTIQLPVHNLPAGLYYVILNDANESTATKIIVK